MNTPWDGYPNCPCGIDGCVGFKLSVKTGHIVRECKCRPCIGMRSQKKGRRAQQITHKRLGGLGPSAFHEESQKPYTVEVTVQAEVKAGGQVPASWRTFTSSEWLRRSMSQAERAVPAGSGALPAVVIDGAWCVIDLRPRKGDRHDG